jgi:hypothetical protein
MKIIVSVFYNLLTVFESATKNKLSISVEEVVKEDKVSFEFNILLEYGVICFVTIIYTYITRKINIP